MMYDWTIPESPVRQGMNRVFLHVSPVEVDPAYASPWPNRDVNVILQRIGSGQQLPGGQVRAEICTPTRIHDLQAEESGPTFTGVKGNVNPVQTGGDRLGGPPPGGALVEEAAIVFWGDEVGMVVVEILDDETHVLHVAACEQVGLF